MPPTSPPSSPPGGSLASPSKSTAATPAELDLAASPPVKAPFVWLTPESVRNTRGLLRKAIQAAKDALDSNEGHDDAISALDAAFAAQKVDMGIPDDLLEARNLARLLVEQKSRVNCEAAVAKGDVSVLKHILDDPVIGRAPGLFDAHVEAALDCLEEDERRSAARDELEQAAVHLDDARFEAAIEECLDNGVPQLDIENMEHIMRTAKRMPAPDIPDLNSKAWLSLDDLRTKRANLRAAMESSEGVLRKTSSIAGQEEALEVLKTTLIASKSLELGIPEEIAMGDHMVARLTRISQKARLDCCKAENNFLPIKKIIEKNGAPGLHDEELRAVGLRRPAAT